MDIAAFVKTAYGMNVSGVTPLRAGAGSEAYRLDTDRGAMLLKLPEDNGMNHPREEAALCRFLRDQGLPVEPPTPALDGSPLPALDGRPCQLRPFVEGAIYAPNAAPDWLMDEAPRLLGRVHAALRGYPTLPEGIGASFFEHMTLDAAASRYQATLARAEALGEAAVADDVRFRLALVTRYPLPRPDLRLFTRVNTHGDFAVWQLVCDEARRRVACVIDWTSACVHPAAWEVFRSFVYAAPGCAQGEIPLGELRRYVRAYRDALQAAAGTDELFTRQDALFMPALYFYQLAVCDYYAQALDADAPAKRAFFLHQATFSTKLLRWMNAHMVELMDALGALDEDADEGEGALL